ncbi:MAG: acyltransferase [Caulobacteraceae bacterium]
MYPSDIRPLTSLRIIAAIWVLVYHFRDHLGLDIDRIGVVAKGYLGVDLFFILSGFILSHVYLPKWEAKAFQYGSFLWARLSRIYPVHLVTLAATVAIWFVATRIGATFNPVAFDPAAIPQHLLLIHAWGTTPGMQWNFPSWSISAEWFAYLCFPLAAVTVLGLQRWQWAPIAVAGVLFGLMFWAVESHGLPLGEVTRLGFIRIVPEFLMGAALYQFGRSVSLPRGLPLILAAGSIVWIAVAATYRLSDAVIWPGLAALIFALAETSKHQPRGILGAPAFVYLGEVSYAVYMTHLPVDIVYFHGLERLAPDIAGPAAWAAWLGVFVATLIAAMATYHLVERPARNWMRAHDPFVRKPPPEPRHEPVI